MTDHKNFSDKFPRFDDEMLRTFVCVAQLHSFSAAAEALNKTTSTISYRIKSLEESLDSPLFVRTTRSVQLTAAGEILLERARQIFDTLEFLPAELEQIKDGIEPIFDLVVNFLLYDAQATAVLLKHLTEEFPHTIFRVRRAVHMGVWDEILYNGAHLALGVPGFHTIRDDFITTPLGVINWGFVVAPDHPLSKLPGPLSNHELRPYTAINVEDTAQHITKRVAWRLPGQKEYLVPDLQTKIECHILGLGVGFLPSATVRALLKRKLLIELNVQVARSPAPLSLAWRREGAGRIATYVRDLCTERHDLLQPFFAPLDPLS